ncbi:DUF4189 domain-containing protein [Neisseria sp. P0019.S003]|uniref:DUF4189 domain-containing protein n=1 Tax=Neisseria sp. P0019.S003 TaxID=3436799 RepID=UPI003F7DCB45
MKKLLFVLLGLASLNVCVANPTYDVTRGALQNNSALCGYGYNPNCGSSGQSQHRRTTEIIHIKVPSKYLALAINLKTGLSGGALDMDSLEAAKKQAIETCEQGGKNAPCKIAVWVRNGCLAVAQGRLKGKWKTFYGVDDLGQAEANALNQCHVVSGITQCRITTKEACSLPRY